ncbi:substrate-binding domain-containing protein, partial [Lachnospiraceae bacterium OttesenSCG-928-D06]|nr:substrate-binding domain-containing protein [Lachnospiraceae bacterium OttesenSCG-928-D06]
ELFRKCTEEPLMATLEDISRISGVAKATVSRALRNDATLKLSADTKEKIFTAAKELGYESKSKKNAGVKSVILVIHKDDHFQNQIDNAFYYSMRTGIENACFENSFVCNFVPFGRIETLENGYNGAIIIGNFIQAELQHIIKSLNTKHLVFSGLMNFYPDQMDHITYDMYRAEELLLEYLYHKNKRTVVYFGGRETPGIEARFSKFYNFKKLLNNYEGMECIGDYHGEHGAQSGYDMMKAWLKENHPLPDAIVASNDPIAFGVLRAMAEEEMNPGISIISINGDSSGEITNPTLTSVDVHTGRIGEQAVQLLKNQIESERDYYVKVELKPAIIERNSVGG